MYQNEACRNYFLNTSDARRSAVDEMSNEMRRQVFDTESPRSCRRVLNAITESNTIREAVFKSQGVDYGQLDGVTNKLTVVRHYVIFLPRVITKAALSAPHTQWLSGQIRTPNLDSHSVV